MESGIALTVVSVAVESTTMGAGGANGKTSV